MVCHNCQIEAKKHGRDRKGNQRWKCEQCRKTYSDRPEKPFENMYLDFDRALKAIQLLCEGCSVRTTMRVTEINLRTLLKLLVIVGEKCERFLEERIQNVAVKDVQADEIWAYVKMKEKEKVPRDIEDDRLGDAYTLVGIERHTKLVLCWHPGRRSYDDTFAFTEKLYKATGTHYQLTTDGFKPYQNAVVHSLGARTWTLPNWSRSMPIRAQTNITTARQRSSIRSQSIYGTPDPDRICTSHVERERI
jgi:transposase-like protein